MNLTAQIVARDVVPNWQAITVDGLRANSGVAAHATKIAGVVVEGAPFNKLATVVISGEVVCPTWSWTAGDAIYLNGTELSATAPGGGDFVKQIGMAKDGVTILVK